MSDNVDDMAHEARDRVAFIEYAVMVISENSAANAPMNASAWTGLFYVVSDLNDLLERLCATVRAAS